MSHAGVFKQRKPKTSSSYIMHRTMAHPAFLNSLILQTFAMFPSCWNIHFLLKQRVRFIPVMNSALDQPGPSYCQDSAHRVRKMV